MNHLKNTNKKDGNQFENELTELLKEHGWWALNISCGRSGQPVDIIAVKNGVSVLIECKVCNNKSHRFSFERIEANQWLSCSLWNQCGNGTSWFALKVEDKVYMVSFETINAYLNIEHKQSLSRSEIEGRMTIDEWLKRYI